MPGRWETQAMCSAKAVLVDGEILAHRNDGRSVDARQGVAESFGM